jgi:site-specific DNA-methyltransferase (adenine-specific)
MPNALYYGDNLSVLKESIADESVDLIYLDPPFNSNASYNVLFKAPSGEQSQAQIEAFEDTWHWNESAERAFDDVLTGEHSDAAIMLKAMRTALGDNDMMAYLAMMAVRLIELHRVLKPTGSLYLHCDPTASHYLKMLLDGIFDPRNFRSEIIWKSGAHSDTKQGRKLHGHIHDVILYYTKSADWTWNVIYTAYDEVYVDRDYGLKDEETGRHFRRGDLIAARPGGDVEYDWRVKKHEGAKERWSADLNDEYLNTKPGWEYKAVRPYKGRYWAYSKDNMRQFAQESRLRHTFDGMPEYKRYLDEMPGVALQDVWTDITPIIAGTAERLGYPTQKPVTLLERIIETSSNAGDLVLDPFCGCGTTVHAAQKLNRQWIGIDVTHLAIALVERRLNEAFPGIVFDVHGVPTDIPGARDLAERDKHQFQMWITGKIGAQPYKSGKKGMDRGIDGYLHFRDANKKPQYAIVSVKGGGIKSGDIRDLKGTMEREKAALGLFLTLNKPTREMEREAASDGIYETEGMKFPRLQVLTAEQILEGKRPQVPFGFTEGFKKASREEDGQARLL